LSRLHSRGMKKFGASAHTWSSLSACRKIYKGQLGTEVELHTGFGGGVIVVRASPLAKPIFYFVSPQADGSYGVSMCSPGG